MLTTAAILCWIYMSARTFHFTEAKGVLLIIGGDTGLELGVYNNTDIKTPNLNQLAKNGVLFTRAYASSLTGGSQIRSEILTGVPGHQNGMFGPHDLPSHFRSYDEVVSLSNILSAEGVATGFIGLSGLGPRNVYSYQFERSDVNEDRINVGRNITRINQLLQTFLQQHKLDNYFLVLSLGDPQRCENILYGPFCEDFGANSDGAIPDWVPATFNSSKISAPYYLPNQDDAKADLANMYRGVDRMDQGIGLYMRTLADAGLFATTLIIFTSTGGTPFPGAKYNALESGSRVPLIIGSGGYSAGQVSDALVSTLDITPTILDYFGVPFPKYIIDGRQVTPPGKSLIPVLTNQTLPGHTEVFSTVNFIQVNNEYPLRAIRNESYKYIWNKWPEFPVALEIFNSSTFTSLVNASKNNEHTYWWAELPKYLLRKEYELYDLRVDPYEVSNVAEEPEYERVKEYLHRKLKEWQILTFDPWLCPRGFLKINGDCVHYV